MPKVALAESLVDWESLIANASVHAADDPALGPMLEELRALLERSKELEALRMRLEGERQEATRALRESKEQGKMLSSRIRSLLKAMYGSTSGALLVFGVRPRPAGRNPRSAKRQYPEPQVSERPKSGK